MIDYSTRNTVYWE